MTSVLPALPPELRASLPAERRGLRRDRVGLMVIDRGSRRIEHARFDDIGQWLRRGDLLVVNTSRTLPGAIVALRDDGTAVQLRPCVRRHAAGGEEWDALSVAPDPPHGNVSLRDGEGLRIGDAEALVLSRREDIPYLWRIRVRADGVRLLADYGQPIRYSYVPERVEPDSYQTVYAA